MSKQAISRVLFPEAITRHRDNDHSSSLAVTREVKRPTRELGRTTLHCSPIWSCSGWGLHSLRRRRRTGELLPHPFTLTSMQPNSHMKAVSFLLHFPSRHRDWALPSILSSGARTFLPPAFCRAAIICPASTCIIHSAAGHCSTYLPPNR